MDNYEVSKHIDHTLLKAVSTWEQIKKLCEEAIEYKTASVCIPPSYIKPVKETFGDDIVVCTVIGFPLGYNTTDVKVYETKKAIEDGAEEVDMVLNIGWVKDGKFKEVEEEIKAIREASAGKILKVIIETCYLTKEEIIECCKAVTNAKADYIKTSTGFGTEGATLENVKIMKENVGPEVLVKAAGGMKTREDLEAFLEAGADRLGTSSGIKLLFKDEESGDSY